MTNDQKTAAQTYDDAVAAYQAASAEMAESEAALTAAQQRHQQASAAFYPAQRAVADAAVAKAQAAK